MTAEGEDRVGKSMKFKAGKMLFGAALSAYLPAPASAYEVDCAILLCLSAGWPASVECNHARNVFIQRITPWPVEPPLQIWRCSMGAAMKTGPKETLGKRISDYAVDGAPWLSVSDKFGSGGEAGDVVHAASHHNVSGQDISAVIVHLATQISAENGKADVDVSGPEFDFVRSIKVWNVMRYSHAPRGRDHECHESSDIRLGTYETQGAFRWQSASPPAVPSWVIPSRNCRPGNNVRAVAVEWTDVEGNHGYEVVNY